MTSSGLIAQLAAALSPNELRQVTSLEAPEQPIHDAASLPFRRGATRGFEQRDAVEAKPAPDADLTPATLRQLESAAGAAIAARRGRLIGS